MYLRILIEIKDFCLYRKGITGKGIIYKYEAFALPNLKMPKIECMKRIRKARRDHVVGEAFAP